MKIRDFILTEEPQSIYHLDIGTLTVFRTFLVAEFKEGLTVGFNNGQEMLTIIYDHFGNTGNFGFICNRVNSFSIIPTDLNKIGKLFTQSPKVAIVNYTKLGKLSAQFERNYWPFPVQLFDDLHTGITWMGQALQPAC